MFVLCIADMVMCMQIINFLWSLISFSLFEDILVSGLPFFAESFFFVYFKIKISTTKNYKRHDKLFNENYSYRFNCRNPYPAPLTLFYRKCCALAFVPLNMIEFSFKELCQEARENYPQMTNFMNYLKETYIGDQYNTPMFPPVFWSVHNRVILNQPRTNNALESWNRRLNSTSRVIHPYFFRFTEIIKKQQQFTEDNIELRISGNQLRKQKKNTKCCNAGQAASDFGRSIW